ncbi:MAG TPA: Z-ring formation inhibitor MciZ [Bacillota bacterium]|nr:Z-ring formation inhibitor MciZ [Bacillota bacterium]
MKVYAQKDGIFVCGKIKEVRLLLRAYAGRYRTLSELLLNLIN